MTNSIKYLIIIISVVYNVSIQGMTNETQKFKEKLKNDLINAIKKLDNDEIKRKRLFEKIEKLINKLKIKNSPVSDQLFTILKEEIIPSIDKDAFKKNIDYSLKLIHTSMHPDRKDDSLKEYYCGLFKLFNNLVKLLKTEKEGIPRNFYAYEKSENPNTNLPTNNVLLTLKITVKGRSETYEIKDREVLKNVLQSSFIEGLYGFYAQKNIELECNERMIRYLMANKETRKSLREEYCQNHGSAYLISLSAMYQSLSIKEPQDAWDEIYKKITSDFNGNFIRKIICDQDFLSIEKKLIRVLFLNIINEQKPNLEEPEKEYFLKKILKKYPSFSNIIDDKKLLPNSDSNQGTIKSILTEEFIKIINKTEKSSHFKFIFPETFFYYRDISPSSKYTIYKEFEINSTNYISISEKKWNNLIKISQYVQELEEKSSKSVTLEDFKFSSFQVVYQLINSYSQYKNNSSVKNDDFAKVFNQKIKSLIEKHNFENDRSYWGDISDLKLLISVPVIYKKFKIYDNGLNDYWKKKESEIYTAIINHDSFNKITLNQHAVEFQIIELETIESDLLKMLKLILKDKLPATSTLSDLIAKIPEKSKYTNIYQYFGDTHYKYKLPKDQEKSNVYSSISQFLSSRWRSVLGIAAGTIGAYVAYKYLMPQKEKMMKR